MAACFRAWNFKEMHASYHDSDRPAAREAPFPVTVRGHMTK